MKAPMNEIDGVLLLDKPLGVSSNSALQTAKRSFFAKKAGHTGSLDPLATGMLPICFGEATKFSQYLLDADKTYYVVARLGIRTTTSDAEGEIVGEMPYRNITFEQVEKGLHEFLGETIQIPSMYSALKYQGKPYYYYARRGETIDRKSRPIRVYELKILSFEAPFLHFEIKVSKGTYIRTIVDDLGEKLGCGAHVAELRRLTVGNFLEKNMVSFEAINKSVASASGDVGVLKKYLLPVTVCLEHLPTLILSAEQVLAITQGKLLSVADNIVSGLVQLVGPEGLFIGVGEVVESGQLKAKRLLCTNK